MHWTARSVTGRAGRLLLSMGGQKPDVQLGIPEPVTKESYPRYDYSDAWKQELEDYHSEEGKLFDPTGTQIKTGDYWEVGHAGSTYAERLQRAIDQAMSEQDWFDQEHDVRNFRPELRYTNRSRRFQNWTAPGEPTINGL